MKSFLRTSVCILTLSLAGPAVVTSMAQIPVPSQERDHDRDHDRRDESVYTNNKYYKQGWKDGAKHKHSKKKWKNDRDREAYEAGYSHGDRGEQWNKHDRDRDRDHDRH